MTQNNQKTVKQILSEIKNKKENKINDVIIELVVEEDIFNEPWELVKVLESVKSKTPNFDKIIFTKERNRYVDENSDTLNELLATGKVNKDNIIIVDDDDMDNNDEGSE